MGFRASRVQIPPSRLSDDQRLTAIPEVAVSYNASLGRASVVLVAVCVGVTGATFRRETEQIRTDDNVRPAGTLHVGVLSLGLDTRLGIWRPDGDDAPGATVPAFAEVVRQLQIPGPLIRVPSGTEVVV